MKEPFFPHVGWGCFDAWPEVWSAWSCMGDKLQNASDIGECSSMHIFFLSPKKMNYRGKNSNSWVGFKLNSALHQDLTQLHSDNKSAFEGYVNLEASNYDGWIKVAWPTLWSAIKSKILVFYLSI